jgi:ribosomal protein S18 acetylase RimI-like enzyme
MSHLDPGSFLQSNFECILREAAKHTLPEKLEETERYLRCLTGLPHPLGNLTMPRHQSREAFGELLMELEAWSNENHLPLAIVLFPDSGLIGESDLAEERGWLQLDNMPGMWMDIPEDYSGGSFKEGVSVRHANDEEGLEQAIKALTVGYPIPYEVSEFFMKGIHLSGEASGGAMANFIASVDGQPAASSSVCIEDGVAGIYCVATLEGFRGRGLGSAVTRAAVAYAARHGAKHALLHATEMGEPIYRKIGFAEQCRIPVYGFGL